MKSIISYIKSIISYILKRNLYHIIFGLFVLVIIWLNVVDIAYVEDKLKFIAFAREQKDGATRWRAYGEQVYEIRHSVFIYPFLFWFFFGVFMLQMWYFSSTNYKFYSWDFIIYCIILIFSRFVSMVGAFGGGAGLLFVGYLAEFTLILIITPIMMLLQTDSTFYSSSIHYPSLITLVICCLIFSLKVGKALSREENNINKKYNKLKKVN